MRTISKLSLLLMTMFFIFFGSLSALGKVKPVTHTVKIEGMKFNPESLTVNAGDTVIWVNEDIVPHTATGLKNEFDSNVIEASKSWKMKAEKKGVYSYFCKLHPTMKATLTVQR